jgi:hypothetical protein
VVFIIIGMLFVPLGVLGTLSIPSQLAKGRIDLCGMAFSAGLIAIGGLSVRHGYRTIRFTGSV